jgi:hypothetical protein
MGRLAPHRGLRGAFEAFRYCPPEHICLGGEIWCTRGEGCQCGHYVCLVLESNLRLTHLLPFRGRGVKLDSDYSGSAPWSQIFWLPFPPCEVYFIFSGDSVFDNPSAAHWSAMRFFLF